MVEVTVGRIDDLDRGGPISNFTAPRFQTWEEFFHIGEWTDESFVFVDHYDQSSIVHPSLVAKCEMSLVAITFLFVTLRIILRVRREIANSEEVLLGIAWITFATAMALETAAYSYKQRAWNEHIFYDTENLKFVTDDFDLVWRAANRQRKMTWTMKVLYYTPLYCVKFAWIRFYYTIIPPMVRKTRILLHFTLGFTVLSYLTTTGLILFWCQPFSSAWEPSDPTLPSAKHGCSPLSYIPVFAVVLACHTMTEILVYALPFFIVLRLRNITHLEKLSVAIIFILGLGCLGLMVCNGFLPSTPVTYSIPIHLGGGLFTTFLWPLEPAWAIIVTCLPAMRTWVERGLRWVIDNIKKRGLFHKIQTENVNGMQDSCDLEEGRIEKIESESGPTNERQVREIVDPSSRSLGSSNSDRQAMSPAIIITAASIMYQSSDVARENSSSAYSTHSIPDAQEVDEDEDDALSKDSILIPTPSYKFI